MEKDNLAKKIDNNQPKKIDRNVANYSLGNYNIINNALGWLCFVVAAVTYLLTIEPTASFWDCPEFIAQGAKLEVGHPPGNPIFMLTARFFVTLFGGIQNAAIAVNSMSALLSAATILLLFWTITHLARKIMVKDDAKEVSLFQMLVIMGAGLCGALAYTWSDTFWFSAVEGEVYAFSSLCTALVFWLILKWENRADQPHSDRYLILIAYVIGVSIAVHLLNLLCIPAIVLVYYYRKTKDADAKGSLIALGISFVIVAAILYGLVPGYIKVAQGFELYCVNTLGWGYNMGVLAYAVVLVAVFVWAIFTNYQGKNPGLMKLSVLAVAVLSGLTFIGDNGWVWLGIFVVVAGYLFLFCPKVPQRVFNVVVISIFVIFVGYSSYALLLVRASANPPMNQNAPDNVFSLASYLNREQYGQRPLFMGPVFAETVNAYRGENGNIEYVQVDKNGLPATTNLGLSDALYYELGTDETGNSVFLPMDNGKKGWSKVAKTSPDQPDEYVDNLWTPDYVYSPDLNMPFTRIYSLEGEHVAGYKGWIGYRNPDLSTVLNAPKQMREEWAQAGWAPFYQISPYMPNLEYISLFEDAHDYEKVPVWKATFGDNFRYFMNYQLNHMYWRYFMWNFAGRQNDYQSNGEPNLGNWISGIPFIDNARLGDQSLLPEEYTTGNKGHNVFFMLPLILGLLGIIWQALSTHPNNPKRGIEQFWVVFFLFFMTGIAIVLYLNQTPGQPRERDYAFAGSFYAFAIWVGLGVPAIARYICDFFAFLKKKKFYQMDKGATLGAACVACAIGLAVPIQMVSQTWDDHDRSNRYTTRDFGANYLNSLEPNAIIFTNGDNDTFPLWYSQEVEGLRTDVRVVNLSYLSTDWYANQQIHPYYDAAAVEMIARPEDYAYDKLGYSRTAKNADTKVVDALDGLRQFYANPSAGLTTPYMQANIGRNTSAFGTDGKNFELMSQETRDSLATWMVIERFGLDPNSSDAETVIPYIGPIEMKGLNGGFGLSKLLSFDIVANSVANNFDRPVYFASTVPNRYYLGLDNNMYSTGVAQMVTPFKDAPVSPMALKAYENIVSKYRWGGLDNTEHNKSLYLDETVRRMVSTMRNSIIETSEALNALGDEPASTFAQQWAKENNLPVPQTRRDMARYLVNLMEEKLPAEVSPYESLTDFQLAALYLDLYVKSGNKDDLARAERVVDTALNRYARLTNYAASLSDGKLGLMGNTDLYMLQYVPVLITYKNYIELQRELEGEVVDAELMAQVNAALSLNAASNVAPFVYMQNETSADEIETEIDAYGEAWEQILRSTIALIRLNQMFGIEPMDYATELLAKYGTSLNDVMAFSGN